MRSNNILLTNVPLESLSMPGCPDARMVRGVNPTKGSRRPTRLAELGWEISLL